MKLELRRGRRFHDIAVAVLCCWAVALSAADCEVSTDARTATLDEIRTFFAGEGKKIVTFVGYSGAGYENEAAMLEAAGGILDKFDPSGTIVNIGATPEGIGAVYALAKRREFTTTGIVSTQAKNYQADLSPCVDHVFYVQDASWGGFLEDSDQLSPTSTAMVENSDLLLGIGGGKVGRDELTAAKRSDKKICFIPADMNHRVARQRAQEKGLPEPIDFRGAAGEAFEHQSSVLRCKSLLTTG